MWFYKIGHWHHNRIGNEIFADAKCSLLVRYGFFFQQELTNFFYYFLFRGNSLRAKNKKHYEKTNKMLFCLNQILGFLEILRKTTVCKFFRKGGAIDLVVTNNFLFSGGNCKIWEREKIKRLLLDTILTI